LFLGKGRGSSISARSTRRKPEAGARLSGTLLWGGGSFFDDFFGRFFGDEEPLGARGGRTVPRRQAEQVDITQFFSDSTNEFLARAAHQAVEWGSLDLMSEHLLYAALEDGVVRRVLEEVGADPEAI
jgi:ATP-dependent Clp protease ATP-binding subunit ClpC